MADDGGARVGRVTGRRRIITNMIRLGTIIHLARDAIKIIDYFGELTSSTNIIDFSTRPTQRALESKLQFKYSRTTMRP